jgi:hypothetical protein
VVFQFLTFNLVKETFMLKRISVLGLLGFAALGAIAMPASADTAVVQQGTQDIYIEGDGNAAVQSSQQVNQILRERSARGRSPVDSTGVVQDSYQGGAVIGEGNATYQESSQINVIRERTRPQNRGNRGRGGRIYVDQDD